MKKSTILVIAIFLTLILNGQTWEIDLIRITGKPAERTLKIKPRTLLNIGTLLLETDTVKESKYYNGRFIGASVDSVQIKLEQVKIYKHYKNRITQTVVIPEEYYKNLPAGVSDRASVAISDIDIFKYQKKAREIVSSTEDYFLFASLAALVIGPFASYNYKEGKFNAETYKYWALGSTAGIVVGISLQMLGGMKSFQFNPAWPNREAKVWKFNN